MSGPAARAPAASLDAMMLADRVAVIGASSDPSRIGGRPVILMKEHFSGTVVPVNPNRAEIAGLPAFASVAAIEGRVDLAVIAVPAAAAEAAVDACLERGVGSIVVFTAGFGEIDAAGLAAQERMAARCAARGVRLLGPNSLGLINFHSGLYATFSAALDNVWPARGAVGIASQSGAVGTYVMALAAEAGIGISHFVATGNEADVDVADCIAWMADDPRTRVVVAYLEGCRDGARLVEALEKARRAGKPVIALKPGSSEAGLAAVRSHTGMLAGSKQVFDAVLRDCGAWPATSIEEAVDLALACSAGKFPGRREAVVVTPSGGVGIMLADAAAEAGFSLPPFPQRAAAEVRALLPLASVANPVDTTAQVSNDFRLFGRVIEIAADADTPVLLVFMAHMGKTASVTGLLAPVLEGIAGRFPDRVMVLITRAAEDFRARMAAAGYLVFQDPNRAVAAVAGLAFFAESFARPERGAPARADVGIGLIRAAAQGGSAASRLLAAIGIAEAPVEAVATPDEARRAAERLGYPVALRIDSPDIQHRTEVGGVRLGIADGAALGAAWRAMMADIAARAPSARIAGALVSPMLKGGVETIIGTQNDPDFGPVAMFGLGGTAAEALRDVSFAPAPVDRETALEMIGRLRARALLEGWRGAPPADREALAQAIVALSALAAAHREALESIEINPFVALPSGGVALDVLVQLRRAAGSAQEGGDDDG